MIPPPPTFYSRTDILFYLYIPGPLKPAYYLTRRSAFRLSPDLGILGSRWSPGILEAFEVHGPRSS